MIRRTLARDAAALRAPRRTRRSAFEVTVPTAAPADTKAGAHSDVKLRIESDRRPDQGRRHPLPARPRRRPERDARAARSPSSRRNGCPAEHEGRHEQHRGDRPRPAADARRRRSSTSSRAAASPRASGSSSEHADGRAAPPRVAGHLAPERRRARLARCAASRTRSPGCRSRSPRSTMTLLGDDVDRQGVHAEPDELRPGERPSSTRRPTPTSRRRERGLRVGRTAATCRSPRRSRRSAARPARTSRAQREPAADDRRRPGARRGERQERRRSRCRPTSRRRRPARPRLPAGRLRRRHVRADRADRRRDGDHAAADRAARGRRHVRVGREHAARPRPEPARAR